jgi:hypothetical protein
LVIEKMRKIESRAIGTEAAGLCRPSASNQPTWPARHQHGQAGNGSLVDLALEGIPVIRGASSQDGRRGNQRWSLIIDSAITSTARRTGSGFDLLLNPFRCGFSRDFETVMFRTASRTRSETNISTIEKAAEQANKSSHRRVTALPFRARTVPFAEKNWQIVLNLLAGSTLSARQPSR